MSNYTHEYNQIFDYLSAPEYPTSAESAVVFGRQDPIVAHAAGDLAIAGFANNIVITGGIGKDSGNLLEQGYSSEAGYLGVQLDNYLAEAAPDLQRPAITLEEKASNGAENARHSLAILTEQGVSLRSLTAVTHATSSRRLGTSLKTEAQNLTSTEVVVHRVPSAYQFDPTNPKDQDEAAAELLRLADWPDKGLLLPQSDLPENLVDFVHDVHGEAPKPIANWQANILRIIPPRLRLSVINFAASHGRK